MNIYVSHSRSFDFRNELYVPLRPLGNHQFTFPHESGQAFINSKDFFKSGKCDLVLAEVSFPSTGQGIELAWASNLGLKIICVYKKDAKISDSLKLVSKEFIEYESVEDMVKKLSNFIK